MPLARLLFVSTTLALMLAPGGPGRAPDLRLAHAPDAGGPARRALLVTDPGVAATGHPERIAEQVRAAGVEVVVFDRARVEPTDASLVEAIDFARGAGAPADRVAAKPAVIWSEGDQHAGGRRAADGQISLHSHLRQRR